MDGDLAAVLAVTLGACLAGGVVKGMLGLGLPMVAVPVLSFVMPVPQAIALLLLPVVASNLVQMSQGGRVDEVVRRFWPLLVAQVAGLLVGVQFLVALDDSLLAVVLGATILALVGLSAGRFEPRLDVGAERWASPSVGLVAGVLGGFTSFYGPPLIVYLNALRLPKETFVRVLATAYFVGSLPLTLALLANGTMGAREVWMSAAAMAPVFVGLRLGRAVRDRIPQQAFRSLVLVALAAIAVSLIWRGLSG
ncbi:sulfite exporter TauE/SafE family protein [Azospirillum sp. ST 5-10]|uniref:sulfite exporter TauE/SafE family protein n=1 Tax=unclassified Azospirillum TaxID=2630922 RepID=UPI003F4A750B